MALRDCCFSQGQVLGLSSCAQCPPKESSRADKELPWAISAAQMLRKRTVARLGEVLGVHLCPTHLSLKLTTGWDNGPRSLQPQSPGSV